MAYNQLGFEYTSGRQSNVVALIWNIERTQLRTSGTTLTAIGSVADANFAAGALTATEKLTSGATGTGTYVLSAFPALPAGFYVIKIYDVTTPSSSSPSPSDAPLSNGVREVYWDGADLWEGVKAVEVATGAYSPGGDPVTITVEEDGSGDPIQGALVWLSSNAAGTTIVQGVETTDSNGEADLLLTDGNSYYMWIRKDGYQPVSGELFTASSSLGNTFEMEVSVGAGDDVLDVDYAKLRRELCRYLGYERLTLNIDPVQSVDIDDFIAEGYRYFLWPEGYFWSFTRPVATLAVVLGDNAYDLPTNFAGLSKEGFTYAAGANRTRITRISDDDIRCNQALENATGSPVYYAIRPKDPVAGEAQRYEVVFYPTPDANYTVSYRYTLVPNALDGTNTHPLGGAMHGETLLECCLAAAEKSLDEESTLHQERAKTCLAASIALDKEML